MHVNALDTELNLCILLIWFIDQYLDFIFSPELVQTWRETFLLCSNVHACVIPWFTPDIGVKLKIYLLYIDLFSSEGKVLK